MPALATAQGARVSTPDSSFVAAVAPPAADLAVEDEVQELHIDESAALKIVIPLQKLKPAVATTPRTARTTRQEARRAKHARVQSTESLASAAPSPATSRALAASGALVRSSAQPVAESEVQAPRIRRELPQVEIQGAYERINGRVRSCAAPSGATGMARIQFRVNPSGKVAWAKLLGNIQPAAFAECATWHVKRLDFGPWQGKPKTAMIAINLGNSASPTR